MTPTATPEALTATLTTIAQLGFTGWLAWYLVSTALPKLEQRQDQRIESLTTAHTERLREQRTDFLAAIKEEREARSNDTHRIISAIQALHRPRTPIEHQP